jgi:hypothetical protein
VTVADGKTHKSNLYGTITATVTMKTGPQDVKIDDVLYIDEICNMLLSVSRLCRKGFKVKFKGNLCKIHSPGGSKIVIERGENDTLFCLPVESPFSEKRENMMNKEGNQSSPNMENNVTAMGA